jgi:hypothetical protein
MDGIQTGQAKQRYPGHLFKILHPDVPMLTQRLGRSEESEVVESTRQERGNPWQHVDERMTIAHE